MAKANTTAQVAGRWLGCCVIQLTTAAVGLCSETVFLGFRPGSATSLCRPATETEVNLRSARGIMVIPMAPVDRFPRRDARRSEHVRITSCCYLLSLLVSALSAVAVAAAELPGTQQLSDDGDLAAK